MEENKEKNETFYSEKQKQNIIDLSLSYNNAINSTSHAILSESFHAIFEYSKLAINLSFLLNGAAGVAVLYNIKNLEGHWKELIVFCALGAACSVLCAAFSYLAQTEYYKNDKESFLYRFEVNYRNTMSIIKDDNAPYKTIDKYPLKATIYSCIARILFFSSLAIFTYVVKKIFFFDFLY